jgi:hypothetical protein
MMSMANHDPMMVNDFSRKKSPITNPIKPDKDNHIQLCVEASEGNAIPLMIQFNTERKARPITNLMMLTGKDPTDLLADSNDNAVIAQNIATSKAANSP